jgi:hypothetical protein
MYQFIWRHFVLRLKLSDVYHSLLQIFRYCHGWSFCAVNIFTVFHIVFQVLFLLCIEINGYYFLYGYFCEWFVYVLRQNSELQSKRFFPLICFYYYS